MKPDEDHCWYNGRHELCKELYPGRYEWCSSEYHRCVECLINEHCPSHKPWCDWDLECEQCVLSTHCPPGEECLHTDGRWVCRRKDCVDLIDEGLPNYCRDRYPSTPVCDVVRRECVECVDHTDCNVGELCADTKCIRGEDRDCIQHAEAGVTDYCEKLFPDRPICHLFLRECVECQFDIHCGEDEWCARVNCIPKDWECEGPEDCLSDRFKCVRHKCEKKFCDDYDNPDAFCDEYMAGWRCLLEKGRCVRCLDESDCTGGRACINNKCVEKTCSEYKQPDMWCIRKYGEGWRCVGHECVDTRQEPIIKEKRCSDFPSMKKAVEFCKEKDPNKPNCDFTYGECVECVLDVHCRDFWHCHHNVCVECVENRDCLLDYKCTLEYSCVRKTCADYDDPHGNCVLRYGAGFECRGGECVLRECFIDSDCPKDYFCGDADLCVWGCENSGNCSFKRPRCSKETGFCEECLLPIHCRLGYDCIDWICVKGADCEGRDKLCDKNEWCNIDTCEEGCRDNKNCGAWTPHCSEKTGMCEECVYDMHCEPGYDCEGYRCVWVGHECEIDSDCPKNWMCDFDSSECIFGCRSNDNCSEKTPHCSQRTGRCEKCWSPAHCELWQLCEDYRCVARRDFEECKEGDKKRKYRCRDGIWVEIECKGPEDCLGHEECINGICLDKERDCVYNHECPSGYFCDIDRAKKCVEQICRTHEECPPGQGCNYKELPWKTRDNEETKCISWREYYCSDEDPCPVPWVCDRATGLCVERLCETSEDCPGGYDCDDNLCVERTCDRAEDPVAFCMTMRGWYYRCREGNCVMLPCRFYDDPDMMCMDTHGASWRCVQDYLEEARCKDLGPHAAEGPHEYCAAHLGIDEAYWDDVLESCEVPECYEVQYPNVLCAQLKKDPSYKCREGECRHGREGEDCVGPDECIRGLRCKYGVCIKKECETWKDCIRDEEWCDGGICVPVNKTCSGDPDCRDDYYCDYTGHCVPDSCRDHYECNVGYCCTDSGECIPCEEHICLGNFDCRRGWRCDLKTNKCVRKGGCVRGSDCDPGYYCNLDTGECVPLDDVEGCKDSSECPPGLVCKGFKIWAELDFLTLFKGIRERLGICVDPGEQVVAVRGVDDEKTCDYCKYMWTMTGREGEFPLPPYHEHCRCYGVFLDD